MKLLRNNPPRGCLIVLKELSLVARRKNFERLNHNFGTRLVRTFLRNTPSLTTPTARRPAPLLGAVLLLVRMTVFQRVPQQTLAFSVDADKADTRGPGLRPKGREFPILFYVPKDDFLGCCSSDIIIRLFVSHQQHVRVVFVY